MALYDINPGPDCTDTVQRRGRDNIGELRKPLPHVIVDLTALSEISNVTGRFHLDERDRVPQIVNNVVYRDVSHLVISWGLISGMDVETLLHG